MIFKGKTTLNKKQKGTKSILVRENLKEKCMGYYSDLRLSITKRDYLIMLEKDEKILIVVHIFLVQIML